MNVQRVCQPLCSSSGERRKGCNPTRTRLVRFITCRRSSSFIGDDGTAVSPSSTGPITRVGSSGSNLPWTLPLQWLPRPQSGSSAATMDHFRQELHISLRSFEAPELHDTAEPTAPSTLHRDAGPASSTAFSRSIMLSSTVDAWAQENAPPRADPQGRHALDRACDTTRPVVTKTRRADMQMLHEGSSPVVLGRHQLLPSTQPSFLDDTAALLSQKQGRLSGLCQLARGTFNSALVLSLRSDCLSSNRQQKDTCAQASPPPSFLHKASAAPINA